VILSAYLISGIVLGVAAGLSPGPLLVLLVSQTLRYGQREGVKVALAPVLTDLPIVAASLVAVSRLAEVSGALAVISVAGGLYLVWLGIESLRIREAVVSGRQASPHSVRKAMLVNFLNPHVYLFWAIVGSPLVLEGAEAGLGAPVVFVATFYACLCGSKALVAVMLGRSRSLLAGAAYLWTIRTLGLALVAFGLWLVATGTANGSRLVQ